MFRKLAIVGIVALVLALAFGSAAALGVFGGVTQAGNDATLACDPNFVKVDFNTNVVTTSEYPDNNPYGSVTSVNVSEIDSACFGKRLMVRVDEADGDMVGFGGAVYGGPSDYCTSQFPGAITIDQNNEKVGIYRTTEDVTCLLPSYGVPVNMIERVVVWVEGSD
jgi:hypothetical protein